MTVLINYFVQNHQSIGYGVVLLVILHFIWS